MGAIKTHKSNQIVINDKFIVSIDLCKSNDGCIHLFGVYHQEYTNNYTYSRLLKVCRETVTKYYPKNITTLEETYSKKKDCKGRVIAFDTIIVLPSRMNTVHKRKYAYDDNGPILQMAHELADVIDNVFMMPPPRKYWSCGDFIFDNE